MSLTRNIRMLTRYSAWANARLFARLAELPAEEVTVKRATGFGNIVNTLSHAYVVDLIWQAHLQGRSHGFTSRNSETEPSLQELCKAQTKIAQWYVSYADELSDEAHNQTVHFKFVDGGSGALTRGDMLLHTVNHKTYHRGYVADLLYQAGSKPPVMDLPVFLRDAVPHS